MKLILLLAVAFEVVFYANSYKIPLMSVPFPANRQGSLYDDDLNDLLYKQTLEQLAELADNQQGKNYYQDAEDYNADYANYDSGLFEALSEEKETPSHSSLGQDFQYIQGKLKWVRIFFKVLLKCHFLKRRSWRRRAAFTPRWLPAKQKPYSIR